MQQKVFMLWRDGLHVPDYLRNSFVAIGNFDGVHQGHRALFKTVQNMADEHKKHSAILTFEPHPQQFFNPQKPFFRLTPEDIKLEILAHQGVDGVFLKTFDTTLAQLSAEDFMSWLFNDLAVAGLVIGHDFHFGAKRFGTPDILTGECLKRSIPLIQVAPVSIDGTIVSSSVIRSALHEGAITRANLFLGYRWFVRSSVEYGDQRGASILGFPTANMTLAHHCPLKFGVYAVRTRFKGQCINGVASFGRRPTFDNGAPKLEVHLFDFSDNIYGLSVDVEFVDFLRGEKRFSGIEELVNAMKKDCETAQKILRSDKTASVFDT